MKNGEATVSAKKTAISSARVGAASALLGILALLPLPLDAAIDHEDARGAGTTFVVNRAFPRVVAVDNEDTLEAAEPFHALAQDSSKPPDRAPPPATAKDLNESLWPPKELGLTDRVQDWLARANREFQTTIIRRLSTPAAGGDAIAQKIEQVKQEDAEAAARVAKEAIDAAQAKIAAEAEAKHSQELSEAAAKAAEEEKVRAAERERVEAARIEAQRRQDELRLAAEKNAAEQRAAEEAAAKEAALTKERELAALREAEAAAKKAAEERQAEAERQALKKAEGAKVAEAAKRKAAEDAKRVADEEAAKAAAAREAEAKAIAAKEAAEKERLAQEAAKRDAEAKAASAPAKQAMVEDVDKDKTDVAAAPSATQQPSAKDHQPAVITDKKSSGGADDVARKPRQKHVHAHRPASNRVAVASNHVARGPVVKRWVRRARQGRCRSAGEKILLPGRYTVAHGDNLWLIALRHYRTGWYFRRIYLANRSVIRDPNLIHPCERLYLPRP
ncbi:LysM peptidoglycan-binding domain-containing protein [Hyphomicrobium sp. 99]|uniref:LysM peptidoglycan-binding domain-containing protein n=1 Tax=Hyphomicrobium sp. 99 TaxID=1163419 RepID=UPI0005F7903A|nr:LysM peptidoglycan-binding domain-containing protein [Hyphomicrobium sp. 99]